MKQLKHVVLDLKNENGPEIPFELLLHVTKAPARRFPNNYPHKEGGISFGDHFERFYCAIGFWKLKDYYRQWEEGCARLKTHDRSCIITNYYKTGFEWWMLYRVDNKVYLYNQIIFPELFEEFTGGREFNINTCYDFLPDKPVRKRMKDEDGNEHWSISEWVLDYYPEYE